MSLLPNDTDLHFPHQITIPASAGSGKTYTLSYRYVQFLLSPHIQANGLRNILAITFTKLAAKEMKERIVKVLKEAALGDPQTMENLTKLVSLLPEEIQIRSEQLVNEILHNYSDFNIRTIDSFLTTVFKASSLEMGVQPNVGIQFDNDAVIDQAFRQYSQNLREGTADEKFIDDLITLIEANDSKSGGYLWNPFPKIVREVRQLQKQFGRYSQKPIIMEGALPLSELKQRIVANAKTLLVLLNDSTLPINNYFQNDVKRLANGDVLEIASKGKTKKYFNKYSDDAGASKEIKRLFAVIKPMEKELEQYISIYAHTFYQPFVRTVNLIEQTIRDVKALEGTVVIDDINRSLAQYLSNEVVPEVYLKLGERITHFMIDEFQDTSPIQWRNLTPLIEEALAKNGSLFAVGDTKQSIYGFRGADWHIFRDLIEGKYFPSAPTTSLPLTTNYRSAQALVDFVKDVFSTNVVSAGFKTHATASGLYNFAQDVPDSEKNKGYVEVKLIEKKSDDDVSIAAQREYILSTIRDCTARGYSYGDVAILTPANADVVEISSWLNKENIPFLSLSTLDIRKRKIIGEIIALLRFLDSPIDNLAFATFVFGDLFQKVLLSEGVNFESVAFRRTPASPAGRPEFRDVDSRVPSKDEARLTSRENDNTQEFTHNEALHKIFVENKKEYFYRTFQRQYPKLWEQYFDRLFSLVGYMPLYDLVSESYKTFSVFEQCHSEESALIKLLECVKLFENSGHNSLNDFLSFSTDEGNEGWSIEIPSTVHAVRIMTVHKAKGMGFPVVIVSLIEKNPRSDSMVMKETEDGISVIKIGRNNGDRNDRLAELYEEKKKEQTIDDLNKLYVALTRAQKEMYVSVLFKKMENLPAAILPEKKYGEKYVTIEKEKVEDKLPTIDSLYRKEQSSLPVARYQKIGVLETRRGDAVHNILAEIEFISSDILKDIQTATTIVSTGQGIDKEHEIAAIAQFLSMGEVKDYFIFKPGRTILREQDIAASSGRLYRMDRVIIDEQTVTIVDFKTGNDERNNDYQEQVRNYMLMIKDIYPTKNISGVLLYLDLRKVVSVV
ncbi:MAG: UvrD-helicase domain-containing protein [Bacteroidetes bacterium]|nr:UvrD-helicase domain-containing protein [Bacteroidota bacterium]